MADRDSRTGTTYLSSDILHYVDKVHAAHDDALERAFAAPEKNGMPAIQVGRSEGRLLEFLTSMTNTTRAVEIGTLAGYSALRIARGLAPGGQLWTLEFEERHAAVARANIEAAGLSQRIEVWVGDAKELLPDLASRGPFDLVFIDADKANYPTYGRWALSNLRSGGLLLGDNAFFFAKLLEDSEGGRAMREFHEHVAARCESVCVPTPDGLLLARKR